MKDLREASFVLGIQIQRDRTRGILSLSKKKAYIDKVQGRCDMKNCSRGDKLSLIQCPKSDLQKKQMKNISYASAVRSLIYAQVCTCADIAYTVEKHDLLTVKILVP